MKNLNASDSATRYVTILSKCHRILKSIYSHLIYVKKIVDQNVTTAEYRMEKIAKTMYRFILFNKMYTKS